MQCFQKFNFCCFFFPLLAAKNGSSNGHCRSLSSSPKPSTTYCPNEDIPLENIALKVCVCSFLNKKQFLLVESIRESFV